MQTAFGELLQTHNSYREPSLTAEGDLAPFDDWGMDASARRGGRGSRQHRRRTRQQTRRIHV